MALQETLLERRGSALSELSFGDLPPSPGSPGGAYLSMLSSQSGSNTPMGENCSQSSTDWWKVYKSSYLVLAFLSLTDSIEYGVVMPSLFQYLEKMDSYGGDPSSDHVLNHYYGLILSAFSAASLCSKPLIGFLADKRPYLETILWSTFVAILGNLLYFFTDDIARHTEDSSHVFVMLLFARILAGVGCANTSLTFAYVARTSPPESRTKYMTLLSLCKVGGFALGPATNAITSLMEFDIGSVNVNQYNSPGIFIAFVGVILMITLCKYLKEPPPYVHTEETTHEKTLKGVLTYCSPPLMLCFINIVFLNFFIGSIEAFITPTTHITFDWEPMQNSFVYLAITGVAVTSSIMVMSLAGKVEDRTWLAIGTGIAVLGTVMCHFLFYYDMSHGEFWLSVICWSMPLSLSFPSNRSLFSRLVATSHLQAFLSSMLSVFASLGALLGPYWVGVSLGTRPKEREHTRVAPATIYGTMVLAFVVFVSNVLILFIIPTNEPILSTAEETTTVTADDGDIGSATDTDDDEVTSLRIVSA